MNQRVFVLVLLQIPLAPSICRIYAPDLCPQKQKKEIVVDTDRVTQYTVTSNYVLVDRFSWGILARVGMFFFFNF